MGVEPGAVEEEGAVELGWIRADQAGLRHVEGPLLAIFWKWRCGVLGVRG
jgi:hypothetical protein